MFGCVCVATPKHFFPSKDSTAGRSQLEERAAHRLADKCSRMLMKLLTFAVFAIKTCRTDAMGYRSRRCPQTRNKLQELYKADSST